jgi:hypothetical protein
VKYTATGSGDGFKVGGSFWYGGTANQVPGLGTGAFDAPVLVLMGDARYDNGPFMLRAVGGTIEVYEADKINTVYGRGVGRRIAGGYVEGGYNLLALLASNQSAAQRLCGTITTIPRPRQLPARRTMPRLLAGSPRLA